MDLFGNLRLPFNTPSVITANQNDYSPGPNAHVRLASDAKRTITGVAFIADGQVRKFTNIGSNDIVLAHQSVSSAAANRIIAARGHDVTLRSGDTIELLYDGESNRWRMFRSPAPYYRMTAAEDAASVVPTYTEAHAGRLLRYGNAKIDGSSDDLAAWEDAAAQQEQGGPAVTWEGNSAISTLFEMPAGFKAYGAGRLRSIITYLGGAAPALSKRSGDSNIANIVLRDFSLIDAGTGTIGLNLSNIADSEIQNVRVAGFSLNSVLLSSGVVGYCVRNRLIGVDAESATTGFAGGGTADAGGHLFLGCRALSNSNGYSLGSQSDCSIIGGAVASSSGIGVAMPAGAHRTSVAGVQFVSNTKDWQVDATVNDCYIGANKYAVAAVYTDNGVNTVIVESDGLLRSTKSVANVNTPSGATARAMPIYANDGTLLGYIPVYAAQW